MKFHVYRSSILMAALVTAALTAHTSQATTLQTVASFGDRSFWDASVWHPAQTPGLGDTVRISDAGGHRLYLGDFAAFAAQRRQISRLHYDGTAGLHVLDWGSKPAGGQAGGLSFSQDDPADLGVGIRVGRTSGVSGNLVIFINAENDPADAMDIRIGGGPFSEGGGIGDILQL